MNREKEPILKGDWDESMVNNSGEGGNNVICEMHWAGSEFWWIIIEECLWYAREYLT